jgi:hypothetical protein
MVSVPTLMLTALAFEAALRLCGYTPYYLEGRAPVPSKNPFFSLEVTRLPSVDRCTVGWGRRFSAPVTARGNMRNG